MKMKLAVGFPFFRTTRRVRFKAVERLMIRPEAAVLVQFIASTMLCVVMLGLYGCAGPAWETASEDAASPEPSLPEFPWPPPQYSGREVVPRTFLDDTEGVTTLFEVDQRLREALDRNGYYENSYYAVPGGFALVTQMEKFESDGSLLDGPTRWSLEPVRLVRFTFREYLQALFNAEPGHYRVIVFAVTGVPFTSSGEEMTAEEAGAWLQSGGNALPPDIGLLNFGTNYACTALIYEYARPSEEDDVVFLDPGSLPGRTHLERAGIWQGLEEG